MGTGSAPIDTRAYVPGDDPRRIAWCAYARFEKLLVRIVADETPLSLALIIDQSASMAYGAPSKLTQACRLAAGFAAVAVESEDRVAAIATARTPRILSRAVSGRRGLGGLLRAMSGLTARGLTDLAGAARIATDTLGGRGLCVVFSDLLDPRGALDGARALRARGHEVVLVEVLTPFELSPPDLSGCTLEDAETGELVELPSRGALAAYRAALNEHRDALDAEATRLGARVLRVSTDDDFDLVVGRALRAGIFRAGTIR